jgi:hypothetical protein
MAPYPAPNSVILLDNASIHHVEEVQALCDEARVLLEFLPPYSPECAPVEMVFGNLKSWMKRERDWIDSLDKDDENVGFDVIERAIRDCVTEEFAGNWFRHVNLF